MKLKKFLTFWMPLIIIVLAINFILIGIGLEEFPEMASKAINLCLG